MAFFDNLKTLLKQKWLQFFQVNRSWITFYMEVESVYTPDGGRRPPSSFILGVVNALEPQLAELMLPFSKLNPDADTLIDVLELNFDPDLLLGNRFNPQVVTEELSDDIVIQALTELDPDELSDMSLDDMADEVVLVQTDDESVMVLSPDEAYALADAMALDEMADHGDPEGTSIDQSLETPPNAPQQNESSDVLPDVWVEDAASSSEQVGNETRLGENKKSEDDEISRLFPNL